MVIIIFIAAVTVIATIAVSLVTAYDLQRQRAQLSKLETVLIDLEKQLEDAELQRTTADGSRDMVASLLEEKKSKIVSLGVELEQLKVERVAEHAVKSTTPRPMSDPME